MLGIDRDMIKRRQIVIMPIVARHILVIMLRNEVATDELPMRELPDERPGEHLFSRLWRSSPAGVTVWTGACLDNRDGAITDIPFFFVIAGDG